MDYRYFPEPDLPPLIIEEEWVETLRRSLPELPAEKKARFLGEWGLPESDAEILTLDPAVAAYAEQAVAACGNPRAAANWIVSELTGRLNDAKLAVAESPVRASALAGLIRLIDAGTISGKIAKGVFDEMFAGGGDPEAIVKEKGLVQISDQGEIAAIVERIVAGNPEQAEQYRGGKKAAIGWFVGQVMRATDGRANPKLVNELLRKALG